GIARWSDPYGARGIGAAGIVEARQETTAIGVPMSGLIVQVQVAPWDRVAVGDILLQLDDRELRAALLTQRAEVRVAETTLQRIRDQLIRLEAVIDPRAISREEVLTRRNDVEVAAAQLEAARARVSQTEVLLERLTVRAPIAGTVLQVNVRKGEFVAAGSAVAPILLGDVSEVQVRADVDEQIAPRVRPRKNAVGFIKGDTTRPIPMTFVRIEPYVVPKRSLTGAPTERVDTRVLQVIFKFANPLDQPVYVGQQMDLFIEE
ncbi:MAG TPA: efflux RND transporter periplasmic adaptor subunit, partial [Candidatus Synoicihabitans sp.]|nr:efflux RND transporter periplasmic adaptor subunit [Candidatus Synoicihabitans sp.]